MLRPKAHARASASFLCQLPARLLTARVCVLVCGVLALAVKNIQTQPPMRHDTDRETRTARIWIDRFMRPNRSIRPVRILQAPSSEASIISSVIPSLTPSHPNIPTHPHTIRPHTQTPNARMDTLPTDLANALPSAEPEANDAAFFRIDKGLDRRTLLEVRSSSLAKPSGWSRRKPQADPTNTP